MRAAVVRQFPGQGMRVAGAACLFGLGLAVLFTRLLSGMLFGVSPADPATLSIVVALVLSVAGIAAVIPAMHAAFLEPMRTLREE